MYSTDKAHSIIPEHFDTFRARSDVPYLDKGIGDSVYKMAGLAVANFCYVVGVIL